MPRRVVRQVLGQPVGLAALILVLAGTAVAAKTALPNNSVGTKQIRNGQVKAKDLGRAAVTTRKLGLNAVTSGKVRDAAGVIGDNPFGEAVVGRAGRRGPLGTPPDQDPNQNGIGAVVGRNDGRNAYGVRGFVTHPTYGIGVLGQAGISGGNGDGVIGEVVNQSSTGNGVTGRRTDRAQAPTAQRRAATRRPWPGASTATS